MLLAQCKPDKSQLELVCLVPMWAWGALGGRFSGFKGSQPLSKPLLLLGKGRALPPETFHHHCSSSKGQSQHKKQQKAANPLILALGGNPNFTHSAWVIHGWTLIYFSKIHAMDMASSNLNLKGVMRW